MKKKEKFLLRFDAWYFFLFYLCGIFLLNISTKSDPIEAKRQKKKKKNAERKNMHILRQRISAGIVCGLTKGLAIKFQVSPEKICQKCFNCALKTHKQ